MHFGLSKNNISLVLCFSSLLPSPPATNCHRYSFSFGANIILFKIQPSSNAKLLRAGPSHTLGQIDPDKDSRAESIQYMMSSIVVILLDDEFVICSSQSEYYLSLIGESRAMRGGEGEGDCLSSSAASLHSNFNF